MPDFRQEVTRVADSLTIHSARAFTLFGLRVDVSDDESTPPLGLEPSAPESTGSLLSESALDRLTAMLYSQLHCREPMEAEANGPFEDWLGARAFVENLSAANCGTGSWQSDFIVRGTEGDGRLIIEKFGVRFWAAPEKCRLEDPAATPGTRAWARLTKEYRRLVPGFYMALGDADDDIDAGGAIRVYWHVTAKVAVELTRNLTRAFNASVTPFRFKLLDDPHSYYRADAAVLYIRSGWYERATPIVFDLYRDFRKWMRAPVSAFVKPLAPGLGVAEDPGVEASFGQHVCRHLAVALSAPSVVSMANGHDRAERTLDQLAEAGFNVGAMYLRPGSRDVYEPLAEVAA